MKNILKVLLTGITKAIIIILKVVLITKLIGNKELRVYIGSVIRSNVTLCNIKDANTGEISSTKNGSFNSTTEIIKLSILGKHYVSTLLHECVHYRQWQIAKSKNSVNTHINMGVRRNAEFYAAVERAKQDVLNNPQWEAKYIEYYMRDWEIEARMITAKL